MNQIQPVLPGTYVHLLIDVVQRWDISIEQLLKSTKIQAEQLQQTFWYVDFIEFNRLLENAERLTHEPALGIYLGLQMTVSCHGSVGMAAMVSKNLGEALSVMEQFIGMRCAALKPRLDIEGDIAYLYLDQPLPEYRLNQTGLIFMMLGFVQMSKALTGQDLSGWIEFDFVKPEYFEQIQSELPTKFVFNQSVNRLVFPKQHLEFGLVMADPMIARLAREQCKRDINQLSIKLGEKNQTSLLVKELLFDEVQGFFKLNEVAENLNISERTLQRQLSAEGTTFLKLQDEVRKKHAKLLLNNEKNSIEQVAIQLGYSETSQFTRAFKRWMKMTPKNYQMIVKNKLL